MGAAKRPSSSACATSPLGIAHRAHSVAGGLFLMPPDNEQTTNLVLLHF